MNGNGETLPLRSKLARFAVVGVANTVIDLLVFSLLLRAGLRPLMANLGAWAAAVAFSFTANSMWSFERDTAVPLGHAALRFISLGALISLGVSNVSIALLGGAIGIWPAKAAGVVVAAALNFVAARWSIESRLFR